MAQNIQKFRGATYDEACRNMRDALGPDALVLRTAEVREGGLFGLFGSSKVEITAAAPPPRPGTRRKSPVEKRYMASGATPPGSVIHTTDRDLERYKQIVSEAQQRMGIKPQKSVAAPPSPDSAPPVATGSAAPLLKFKPAAETPQPAGTEATLRREMREMRQLLEVLVAETPSNELPQEFAPYYRTLLERGCTRKAAATVLTAAMKLGDPDVIGDPRVFRERLKLEVRKRVPVTGGIALQAGRCRVVALAGATGVGKTTSIAKLAGEFAVRRLAHVALITADTYRVGAPDQLNVYANIIGLPMKVVNNPQELRLALRAFQEYDLVLIDTAGGSQFNVRQIAELKEMLAAAEPDETLLVLGATTRFEDLQHVIANFQCLKPTSLLVSKLDETRHYGTLLSLTVEYGLPLSYLSTGQDVPDDIVLAESGYVADLIIEGRERRGRSGATPS